MNKRHLSMRDGVLVDKVAIVFDGQAWHVRRVRLIEHDLDRDEKIYRCDLPIVNDCGSLAEAVAALITTSRETPRKRVKRQKTRGS